MRRRWLAIGSADDQNDGHHRHRYRDSDEDQEEELFFGHNEVRACGDKRLIVRRELLTAMSENPTATAHATGRRGRSVVLFVYAVVVAIAGLTGVLLGTFGPDELRPVDLFFLIELQPTPLGLAMYGMGTMGVGLGILLVLVNYVSQHYDA